MGNPNISEAINHDELPVAEVVWQKIYELRNQLKQCEGELDANLARVAREMKDFIANLIENSNDKEDNRWKFSVITELGENVTIEIQGGDFFIVKDSNGNIISKVAFIDYNNGKMPITRTVLTAYSLPLDENFEQFTAFNPYDQISDYDCGVSGYGVIFNSNNIGARWTQRIMHPKTQMDGQTQIEDPITHLQKMLTLLKRGTQINKPN